MSVLIKGMEMPTDCESCPCKTTDAFGGIGCQTTGYIPLRKANQGRPDWCPLVPVPEHGRLIDADEFLRRAIGTKCFRGDYALMLEKLVGESTTIIPAEEGDR